MSASEQDWGFPSPERSGAATYLTLIARSMEELDSFGTLDEPTEAVDVPVEPDPVIPGRVGGRYERRELLGKGGMGEVWRVWDTELQRTVALKVLHSPQSERTWIRFEEEARVAAQLQHPGIIPVHDIGRLDDGRMWFTMKEVRGQTLEDLIVRTHKDWRMGRTGAWGFRRLIEGFHRVCETMAYAHARGVVHRDIKPSNLMFGDYGEILVLDWGLAKVLSEAAVEESGLEAVNTSLDGELTQDGVISGTPNYMSPEQAQGRSSEAGAAADVYALGATLYDLLCERPPRVAKNVRQLIFQTAMGQPPIQPPSVHDTGAPRDEELDAIVIRALHVDEDERYPHAGELAADLAAWLDGAKKRERAMKLVVQARTDLARAIELEAEGAKLAERAAMALEGVPKEAPVDRKVPGWSLEDDSRARLREAADTRNRAIQGLRSALTHAPDLPAAHAELATEFARRHKLLEEADRHDEARIVAMDVELHDRAGEYTAYLKGTGAVTLHTDRPVEVRVHRYVEKERRLQPVYERSLGTTPLDAVPLEMGSYLLTLHAEDGVEVRYPVWIRRQEHWDGVPPDGEAPSVIRIPKPGELADDDCYVPQGWFWAGDDEFEHTLPLHRAWTDAFIIKKYPVTVAQYVEYLNGLLDAGRVEDAEAAEPTFPGAGRGLPLLKRDEAGRWLPEWEDHEGLPGVEHDRMVPVTVLSVGQASEMATRHGGQLPTQIQWQRAARGSDRRPYPWGGHLDPAWCQMRFSPGDLLPVGTRPYDRSPFDVADCAGNHMDWTADTEGGKPIAVGGYYGAGPRTCYVSSRSTMRLGYRNIGLGLRILRRL